MLFDVFGVVVSILFQGYDTWEQSKFAQALAVPTIRTMAALLVRGDAVSPASWL
jgi:hypothetical protein